MSGDVVAKLLVGSVVMLAGASVAVGSGCTTDEPKKTRACVHYEVPATLDLTTPVVSFKNDVLPIAVLSCAFTSCHGEPGGNNNGIYWGSKTEDNDATAIRAGIVDAKSLQDPRMNFVTAGDPPNSYVMHKIDGDSCTLDSDCKAGNLGDCGDTMPQESDLLPVEQRDLIRRWIAQGALDN